MNYDSGADIKLFNYRKESSNMKNTVNICFLKDYFTNIIWFLNKYLCNIIYYNYVNRNKTKIKVNLKTNLFLSDLKLSQVYLFCVFIFIFIIFIIQ